MVVIRQATEKDIPHILELYRQLAFSPPPPDTPRPSVEEYQKVFSKMSKMPGYRLLVAEEDDTIVGTTVVAVLPGIAHGTSPFAVVEYVVVDENYRRKGIGKLLMDYVKDIAGEAGCYKIMLTSDNRRVEAHEFYRSLGFEASAHGFRFYF
jgi:GNAT superfamily N-acetyltransferase